MRRVLAAHASHRQDHRPAYEIRAVSRAGDWRGGCRSVSSPRRFTPYVRFSRIRLSDIVHRLACAAALRTVPVSR